jgi:hypothetical protein
MMTQLKSFVVAMAIIALSFTFLGPRIVHPPQPVVLLNQSVLLTDSNYEQQYSLALKEGDQLQIQLSGNGQLVNLIVTQSGSPTQPLLDEEIQTMYYIQWTVPQTGSYVFDLTAENGASATITVTKI